MELNQLRELIATFEASGLSELELSLPDNSYLRLAGGNAQGSCADASGQGPFVTTGDMALANRVLVDARATKTVLTPAAGVFMSQHPMRKESALAVGTQVQRGDVVGYLKIGLICAPILASATGVVTVMLATEGAMLGFGEPVMDIAEAL